MRRNKVLSLLLLCSALNLIANVATSGATPIPQPQRVYIDLDQNWRFTKGDPPTAMHLNFDDSNWQEIQIPHDWDAEGPFEPRYASSTGYAPGGVGWYRTRFTLKPEWTNHIIAVEFDGVYNNAQVWLNGHYVGGRPYGYSSFECDVSSVARYGETPNLLAVRVDHSRYADSRWYTGSGIYRPVRVRITPKLHINHRNTFIHTPLVTPTSAVVRIQTTIENLLDTDQTFSITYIIFDPKTNRMNFTSSQYALRGNTNITLTNEFTIPNPLLWSVETPNIYTLEMHLITPTGILDKTTNRFGIRTIRFDPQSGFFLNEHPIKLKGVCLHHDAGALGAAVPRKVWQRRLTILKEIGVNAIRTSHNPASPDLLDLCDELGFLVKAEAFDEFCPGKNKWIEGWNVGTPSKHGYAEHFHQWAIRDLTDMILRDRNHPSIIMWSIGNEIDYPNDPFTHPVLGERYQPGNPSATEIVRLARPLIETAKALDPTRPVTMALANLEMSQAVGLPELLDIVGYNYQTARYLQDHLRYPHRVIFGSETGHGYNDWLATATNDFVCGQFLWTGIDYLGEARAWPNRANGSGLLDLCGFKKPIAWYRQSLWSDKPMVYLCASETRRPTPRGRSGRWEEHWNWASGASITVFCFTTCPEVALFLNGREIGRKTLKESRDRILSWEVKYEPGELQAIGLSNGIPISSYSLKTAGKPTRIELYPDTTTLKADNKDVCHVEFWIADEKGVRVPWATNRITVKVAGPGRLLGIENGNLDSIESGKGNSRCAYRGRGLIYIQSTKQRGQIEVTVESENLSPAKLQIQSIP